MKVKDAFVVQLGKQLHLSESRRLPLRSRRHKLGSVVCFTDLLGHTLHIGKRSPGRRNNIIILPSVLAKMIESISPHWSPNGHFTSQFPYGCRSSLSGGAFSSEGSAHHPLRPF